MNPDAINAILALEQRLARMKCETGRGRASEMNRESTIKDARRVAATAIASTREVDEALRRALADLIEVTPDL